jgi:long-subunit fatty acid transport protein
MIKNTFKSLTKVLLFIAFFGIPTLVFSQQNQLPKPKSDFWNHVQFGGGFGLALGSDYTNITIAPSAIYNFDEKFALGTGLQYSYIDQENYYTSNVFGASLIGLFNPLPQIQLSLEVEEVNVNNTYKDYIGEYSDNFWYTGLYVGAGYRTNNVTIGFRYNLLFDRDIDLYGQAFMPFIRAYF